MAEVAKETVAAPPPALTEEQKAAEQRKLVLADIGHNVELLSKSVSQSETRYAVRALRKLSGLRKRLSAPLLRLALATYMPASIDPALAQRLKNYLGETEAMAVDAGPVLNGTAGPAATAAATAAATTATSAAAAATTAALDPHKLPQEIELYLHMLVLAFLLDSGRLADARQCGNELMERIKTLSRRSADVIAARCYYFYARAHELAGSLSSIRPALHDWLRTAALRCDEQGQAVLLNALYRSFLHDNLIDQAELLAAKTKFPESAPNSEVARYFYSLGRIKALQLDYSEAHDYLTQAARKAPTGAVGFLQHVYKLDVIVTMLMGELPEREIFRRPYLARPLAPYLELTQAVRLGEVGKFAVVVKEHEAKFRADKTYTLILRLRYNVLRTGVRILSTSYSRISLQDMAAKLQLDSAEDAEYITAKAIRDGVIDAVIHHGEGYVASKEVVDVYATGEPQEAFHKRITFCLKMHNSSVMALRFPPNAFRKYLQTTEESRQLELQEAEIAEEIEKGGEDDEEF